MPEPPPPRLVPHLAVLPKLGLALIPIGVYTYAVTRVEKVVDLGLNDLGLEASILSALILTILLGFRNNAAYDRWWEARKLWGQLNNEIRNFSLKVAANPQLQAAERAGVAKLLIGFTQALKDHLRGMSGRANVPALKHETAGVSHAPRLIAGQLYNELAAWRTTGKIDGFDLLTLDPHARALMDICGACERIRSAPLPTSYRALLRIGIGVYLLVSPIYIVRDFAYWAVPIELIVAFFMLGVEMVAHEVEEPFGVEGDDLPLEKFCDTIEQSVRETLG